MSAPTLLIPFKYKYCSDEWPLKPYPAPKWRYLKGPHKRPQLPHAKLPVKPDFELSSNQKPPVLVFDPTIIRGLVDDRALAEYRKMDGFQLTPASWTGGRDRAEHFIVARPGLENVEEETVQVLSIPKDPPKPVDDPHTAAKPREPLPFHKPEQETWIVVRDTAEPRLRPRAGTARTQRPPPVFPYARDDEKDRRSVRQNRPEAKIINPGTSKQIFRNLAAVFHRVRRT
jgi:hypothetical protein